MIRSKKYLAGSRGAPCTFRIPGICNGDWSTTVPCHIRDGNKGTGNKASDLSVANGCFTCHDAMDGRSIVLSKEDWLFYALRGLQETLQQRFDAGLLIVPVDADPPKRPMTGLKMDDDKRKKAREFKGDISLGTAEFARKPKDQRTPIPKRKDPWPKRGWAKRDKGT